VKPSLFEHARLWWGRIVAFTLLRLALRSKHVGKIVRVATDQMIILDRSQAKVSPQWWKQIDAAYDFCEAWEEAEESTNEAKETALIVASNKIENLALEGYAAPRLTLHEKKRKEAAIHYGTNQMKGTLKQWKPTTLLSPNATEMQQTMIHIPPTSAQKTKRGISRFFRKEDANQ